MMAKHKVGGIDVEDFNSLLREALKEEEMLDWLKRILLGDSVADRRANEELQRELDEMKIEREGLRAQLAHAQEQADRLPALEQKRDELQSALDQERGKVESTASALAQAQGEQQALNDELAAWRKDGVRLDDATQRVLQRLREDSEMHKRFSVLGDTPADPLGYLLNAVSAFSSESEFKRLWLAYKERCIERQAPLAQPDMQVLEMALSWFNRRLDKPHALEKPLDGENYDYQKQQTAPGMTGTKITAVWLPGITQIGLKPLVAID